jgi:hypothetical protein
MLQPKSPILISKCGNIASMKILTRLKTASNINHSAFLVVLFSAFVFQSCNNIPYFGHQEGKIIYDVAFPYESIDIKLALFPSEMTCIFDGEHQHTRIESAYGIVKSEFIIDHKKKEFNHLLACFGSDYVMHLNEGEYNEWIKQFPSVRLEATEETMMIAGYECKKTIAYFKSDSLPSVDLYSTTKLDLDGNNWWNTYAGVEGTLLGYDIEQYGRRMQVRAREVIFQKTSQEDFLIPSSYTPISASEMKAKLDEIVKDYLD